MDKITLSLDSLSVLFDKDASELVAALITTNDNGEKIAVDESQIKSYLTKALGSKMKAHADGQVADKVEQARGRARKEAFEEVENKAKELGVDMRFEKDGLSKLADHFKSQEVDPDQLTDEQIKSSDVYKNKVIEMQKLIDDGQTEYDNKIKGFHRDKVRSKLIAHASKLISAEDSGLVAGKDSKVTNNLIALMIDNSLNGEDQYIDIDKDGNLGVYKDGKLLQTEESGFKPIDVDKHIMSAAKGYFLTANAPDIGAPPADSLEAGKLKVSVDGKDQIFDVPTFKDANALAEWTNDAMTNDTPIEVIQEATKVFNESNS